MVSIPEPQVPTTTDKQVDRQAGVHMDDSAVKMADNVLLKYALAADEKEMADTYSAQSTKESEENFIDC